jgi:hypothetical protein
LIFVLIEYFPFNKFPSILFDSIKITSVITSFFVLLSTFIHFLFKPINYYEIKNVISKWGGDQVYSIEGWDNFYSEEFVSILKRISNQKKKSKSFYFLKPKWGGHVGFMPVNKIGFLWSEELAFQFIDTIHQKGDNSVSK